jgi:hypothetical protein
MRSMVEGAACRFPNPLRQSLRDCHLPASGRNLSHLHDRHRRIAAILGTFPAHYGAELAMLMVMLLALGCANVAGASA